MGKIPEQAKEVFAGPIFRVFHWEQEMYDGSQATFEMLKRQDTSEVIMTKGDQILIQEQEQPAKPRFLSFPGGRVEEGEDPLVGAKREVIEETGHVSDDWQLLHQVDPISKMEWTIYVYVARECEWKQEMELDGGEKIDLKWVGFEELLELLDSDANWHIEQDLRMMFIRAKYDEASRNILKKRIFG